MDSWLRLAVAEGYDPTVVAPLLDPSTPADELLALRDLPPRVVRRLEDPELGARAAELARAARRRGMAILTPDDSRYPPRLALAPLRPVTLFARGDPAALASPRAVAVVGSRTPTPYGMAATEDFVTALCRADMTIWSGLATGVDAIAHRTTVDAGGRTVAVLAGGLDRLYPEEHEALADRIAGGIGALVSEAPPGRPARRGHFPRRNRIVAGAVAAVLVIEAGQASGSLHTARFAAEAGVPVFAVPGAYTSPRSRGCHDLIADGAQIAAAPDDLLRRLGVEVGRADGTSTALDVSADEAAILTALEPGPRPADTVQREASLDPDRFLAATFSLVEARLVRWLPGDLLARVSRSAASGGRT